MEAEPSQPQGVDERALFEVWPSLAGRVPWVPLGRLPTPVQPLDRTSADVGAGSERLWVKRDDLSSPIYGGNKVRTLESLFGLARSRGATRVYSTGAFGSNHALATVLHAPRCGLEPGAILFPQPPSDAALQNLTALLAAGPMVHALPHWSLLPLGMSAVGLADRRAGVDAFQMVPGGATPEGALGYVSAGLELALQVERGELPAPSAVVVGVGSTCTSAGLLVGMRAAERLGIGWSRAPHLISVRVTPWPVTSALRIVGLAARTARWLSCRLTSPKDALELGPRQLAAGLEVDGGYLGRGYGHPTPAGRDAIERFSRTAGFELDTTYSAKAAAAALDRLGTGRGRPPEGPLLFWSTKSTAPLPPVPAGALADAPRLMRWWIERAERRRNDPRRAGGVGVARSR